MVLFFFFFQAEDGIRDKLVTGVQTCALPILAQANAHVTEDGGFTDELVLCRKRDDYPLLAPNRIDFMDVAPEQLVSIAAALIPFLEHDDANRALMGSNMQRQSVPLLFPQIGRAHV